MITSEGISVIITEVNENCKNLENLLIDGNDLGEKSAVDLNNLLLSKSQLKKFNFSCI